MEKYLVGGAVRDKLLGLPVKERDWVVVGSTPEQLIAQGFKPVGNDFPVFLHPESGEEYALARTERKTAPGYSGFQFHASADVTLEEDLKRRDLTINAIASDQDGQLIDPYGGRQDIEQRILRHVSKAFVEDPVRILRIAKFSARFADFEFEIHKDTQALMARMVSMGEVDALVPERVWQETQQALTTSKPALYFEVLRECGALARLMPELDQLFGIPQPVKHHPEIDCGLHSLMVLEQAAALSEDPAVRFAALVHDLGKGLTREEILPSHHGHEDRGIRLIENLCKRLKAPNKYRNLAVLSARYHSHCHRTLELKPATLLKVLEALDAFRRPEQLEDFLLICEADARGRTGFENRDYPQKNRLRDACEIAGAVDTKQLVEMGLSGKKLGSHLRDLRLEALSKLTKPPRL